jgi:(1->4)-alpha-D-glucan 1-alpha-D-glucosylmutase
LSTPHSTYRVQLGPRFTFDALAETADYLAALGVGAVYTSPVLQASPGSTHGYDVVDPTRAAEPLGGERGRQALVGKLRSSGLGLVVDIVPNHMGIEAPEANPWWWDVLANGPASRWASFFDIDFRAGPLLVPILADDGDGGEAALADLRVDGNRLTYHEHSFPIAEGTGDGSVSEVHARQHYRLVSWRTGSRELNYRRFFDINTLAAVRVEDAEVFAETHAEVLRWVNDGEVQGLRIDHPDGLSDPGGYLDRLRRHAPKAWIVVEKILAPGERLPVSWPVDGSTGYDALREICGVFVDPAGEEPLTGLSGVGGADALALLELDSRRFAAASALTAEVHRIAVLLPEFPAERARPAVAEFLSSFHVYRSYLPDGRGELEAAASRARRAHPEYTDVIEWIVAHMLGDPQGELATRVQQTSGMVMAKGVEDTAFYRYPRLVSLNEVGGDPGRFGVSLAELHAAMAERESASPATMTTLSTHDTKRSEDVRARISVLSEVPGEFGELVGGLREIAGIAEPTLEMLAWQTLVGAWPIGADRLSEYLFKAAREAKLRTAWTARDADFEQSISDWVERVTSDSRITGPLGEFVSRIREAGWSNALGQKLLQLAGPGVPDVYQGTECWDDSLVDPDNRRPVDFAVRRELLARLDDGWTPELDSSGAAKLLLVSKLLRQRRDTPALFTGYRPIHAEGPAAAHAVAFTRGRGRRMVAVATRLPIGLRRAGGWADTVLPLPATSGWRELLTGSRYTGAQVELGSLLARFPVAVLVERE